MIEHPESAEQVGDGLGVSFDLTERNRGSSYLLALSYMSSHPVTDVRWPTSRNSRGLCNGNFRQVCGQVIEIIALSLRSLGAGNLDIISLPVHTRLVACVRVRGEIVVEKAFASKFALVRNTTATALALVFLALPPLR